ncbi:Uncharacterised protein [Mycobacteroides abscessus subsp. abscessus]|nr:Uncharacterised protein [Mycobacteroides abscessus subsp. abscessus]SKW07816.1 Uncharacterised protein [Mycobacteroides abscessus subsp. abscessus]
MWLGTRSMMTLMLWRCAEAMSRCMAIDPPKSGSISRGLDTS